MALSNCVLMFYFPIKEQYNIFEKESTAKCLTLGSNGFNNYNTYFYVDIMLNCI